jgi:hypothetical protein
MSPWKECSTDPFRVPSFPDWRRNLVDIARAREPIPALRPRFFFVLIELPSFGTGDMTSPSYSSDESC